MKSWKPNKIRVSSGPNNFSGSKPAGFDVVDTKLVLASAASLLLCVVAVALSYTLLPLVVEFPTEFVGRLSFTLRAELFVVLWLVVGSWIVSGAKMRLQLASGNQNSSDNNKLSAKFEALNNTREQVLLTFCTHLIAATALRGSELAIIPAAIFLFWAGRLAYFFAYPRWIHARQFGVVTSMTPVFFLIAFSLSRIGSSV